MLATFANLPRPVQAVVMLASGASIMSLVMSFIPGPMQGFFIYIAVGIAAVAVLLGLFKLVMILRDKSKSGPFAGMLAKGGRTTADPALKARMDDLRRKFEEGTHTFKQAGKDLYSLPWYLLVGPAGSGKTEALRHCNVGFPPGLQDPLQGSGGTLNMNWWFTNHSVVLDTAGRMFMEGADEGGGAEWREFLKMLKGTRPNCPVNGLLLVISSESLLKDSAEKIEQTAGAIARQLDVVQRTLDVRFPVTIIVTKCDKIIGFREFFDHIADPNLQHQILGWSNPSSLDEAFKPDQVDKHLETVRQKLMRRRMGLMQNPVHTTDANARRTDQVDEMFELPDNLVRISPRLRRYLEMIFVAGEWSPKPLFLRGIYFTSSMREGQALDVSLAQALGVDVDSIPGSRDWDKDKSYFLRDLFMAKVFKEKGLVTRATNVSKALAKQRALLVGGAMATAVIVGGIMVLGYFQFNSSLGPPSKTWAAVRGAVAGDAAKDVNAFEPAELSMIGVEGTGAAATWVYRGRKAFSNQDVLGSDVTTPVELIAETGSYKAIDPPMIARPVAPLLGFSNSFLDAQEAAHRKVVETTTIVPLLEAARSKLQVEKDWGPDAVAALAQLVRVQTSSYEGTPAVDAGPTAAEIKDAVKDVKAPKDKKDQPAVDVDSLMRYVIGTAAAEESKGYAGDRAKIRDAVKAAYPRGLGDVKVSPLLGGKDETNCRINEDAALRLADRMKNGGSPSGDMGALLDLQSGLSAFAEAEKQLRAYPVLKAGATAGSGLPRTMEKYAEFERDVSGQLKKLAEAKAKVDDAVGRLGVKADNPVETLKLAGEQWEREAAGYFNQLIDQLPRKLDLGLEGKAAQLAEDQYNKQTPAPLRTLREKLVAHRETVVAAVKASLEKLRGDVQAMAPLTAPGQTAGQVPARAYAARYALYVLGANEIDGAGKPVGAFASLSAKIDEIDGGPRRVGESAQAWTSWTPAAAGLKGLTDEQKSGLTVDRDEAERMARRMAEVAGARRVYETVKQAVTEWPKDVEGVKARVKALADAKIDAGAKKPDRPKLKLTEMEAGGEFERGYFVDAAKDVMGDWSRVRLLVEPGSPADRQVLDADGLKGAGYVAAGRVTEDYAHEYVRYWRRQATEGTAVSSKSWQDFSQGMRDLIADDINDVRKLQETVSGAMAAVPANVMAKNTLEDAKTDVSRAFAGLSSEAFSQSGSIKESLRNWRRLATVDGGATGAVGMLRASFNSGDVQADFFAQYGKGVAYWDGVVVRGVELLTEATQGDVARAQNLLLSASKAPICFGPASMQDLTPEELRAVADAAQKVASSAPGGTTVKPSAGLDSKVADLLARLFGANFIKSSPERQQWFTRLQGVLDKVAGKDPVRLSLNLLSDTPPQGAGGRTMASDAGYKFAALFVNGKKVGEAFNIFSASSIPADKAKDLVVTLPVQSSEIGLYTDDPKNTDRAPAERLALPGSWSLLGAMLRNADSDRVGPGQWRVMAANERVCVWLTIKIDPDVPAKAEWPTAATWPGQ